MTNFDKIVRWDADFYNSLSDSDCIVCLTDQQIYLVGQIIEQLKWANTRWSGNTSGMDFVNISEELEYRLADRMTCQQITSMANTINRMELSIAELNTKLDNLINPDPDPDPVTEDTPFNEAISPEKFSSFGTTIEGCDTPDKDALYGAINTLVRFMVQVNADFLENLTQNTGNYVEQAQTLLGAFPPTDLLAADDITKYINFIIDELLEEYNAIVTEELIQSTVCDLFCIGVANGCNTNMYDISNYFGAKVDPIFGNFVETYAELVTFAFTGTFTGTMYFDYLMYFQLASVAIGEAIGLDSVKSYEMQLAAGQNSPDNDWFIFCVDCPEFLRVVEYDFTQGLQGWEFILTSGGSPFPQGTETPQGLESVAVSGTVQAVQIRKSHTSTWRARAYKIHYGIDGTPISHLCRLFFRPTPNSQTGAVNFNPSVAEPLSCADLYPTAYLDGYNQLYVDFQVTSTGAAVVGTISKIEIYYVMEYAPIEGVVTVDEGDICV